MDVSEGDGASTKALRIEAIRSSTTNAIFSVEPRTMQRRASRERCDESDRHDAIMNVVHVNCTLQVEPGPGGMDDGRCQAKILQKTFCVKLDAFKCLFEAWLA